jgi:predicted 3-demethylubiquinone-9 3-methyltransferase (glyoxalase superfamily)
MQKITPCLWIDDRIEEMVNLYVSVFRDGKIDSVSRYPDGRVLTIEFTLFGQKFQALNGGPQFQFTEALSLSVSCRDQAEVDRYWDMLTADGGEESMCSWLKDKYGVSWQIVPDIMIERFNSPDRAAAGRAMQAMMQMRKIVIADIEKAYAGG